MNMKYEITNLFVNENWDKPIFHKSKIAWTQLTTAAHAESMLTLAIIFIVANNISALNFIHIPCNTSQRHMHVLQVFIYHTTSETHVHTHIITVRKSSIMLRLCSAAYYALFWQQQQINSDVL